MINKIFYILLLSFIITSCNKTHDGRISMTPVSLDLEPPPGPPAYRKGWADGCESGSNAYSSTFYKIIRAFDYKFDPKLRNNRFYYQAWKDAFYYCSVYWERTNNGSI